ncbi:DUF29 domain-containing protein [Thiococcus pfennigii]|uniref:DUF29 domain-containing protein n=1 Tax=Thiococcus pfennigii TaxID=1057 RepID=UPI001F5BF2F3|nr:DUF29 domain-containing protein [Thiococcus pfennigii]
MGAVIRNAGAVAHRGRGGSINCAEHRLPRRPVSGGRQPSDGGIAAVWYDVGFRLGSDREGGTRSENAISASLQVLLVHRLKHQYRPERRGKGWLLTINHQRTAIERLLEPSPSLRRMLDEEIIERVYGKAVRDAVIEAASSDTCSGSVVPIGWRRSSTRIGRPLLRARKNGLCLRPW